MEKNPSEKKELPEDSQTKQSDSEFLTPSEIESMRKDFKESAREMREMIKNGEF